MDYKIAKNANIILGLCSVTLEVYAFFKSESNHEFEKVFLAVTSFYILESITFLIFFANKPKKIWELIWRIWSSIILLVSGGVMIWTTLEIQDNCDGIRSDYDTCQLFELKISTASVTIANAIFYLLAKSRARELPHDMVHNFQGTNPGVYRVQYEYDVHSAPGMTDTIFSVPRVHLQPHTRTEAYIVSTTATSTTVVNTSLYPAIPQDQAYRVSSVPANPSSGWVNMQQANRY